MTHTIISDSIGPYLNEIAERLWAKRAAVMVGSGFSKNASHLFPDWGQLGDLFYQKAHGDKPDLTKQKYLNPLRLAEEVQAGIGRPALENLLLSSIPDLDVAPSDLHIDLLNMPWVDVFTTNYDTLLERASAEVVNRRYEPVVNKEDLPYATQPRIVKLHGSFPSERPFIITEEDYRRYPYENASFVNTVQQSLLENTLCLIGFSGDDPNFLQWIGWIRDNLGKDKTQKLYLIGLFEFSPATQQLLTQRGIIVIDLSGFEGVERNDHSKALNLFFKYLQSKNPNSLDWPKSTKLIVPSNKENELSEIQSVTNEWRLQRESYPGWLILPYINRKNLWAYTNSWVTHLPKNITSPVGLDIQYVFELIWRLEKCLLPVFEPIVELCVVLLEKYWPFQVKNTSGEAQFYVTSKESYDLPWTDIRQAWIFITLAMLRFYREEGRVEKWKETEKQIKKIKIYLSADQKEFLSYEGFLFSLFTLDILKAKQKLINWKPNASQPYWMTKRAAALAEIGQFSDTDEQVRLSLLATRKKVNEDTFFTSYLSESYEAFQMVIFRYLKDANDWTEDSSVIGEEEKKLMKKVFFNEWRAGREKKEFENTKSNTEKIIEKIKTPEKDWEDLVCKKEEDRKNDWKRLLIIIRNNQKEIEMQQDSFRWDELKAFRCDPWNEMVLFELALKGLPTQKQDVTEKREFDIGRISQTRHFHSTDQEALKAYEFLRFCEEVGLPFRIANYTMAAKTAESSLRRIWQYSPFWTIATFVRLGDIKAIDSLFNREVIVEITANKADELIKNYLSVLDKNQDDIWFGGSFRKDNFGVRLAQLLPEVISRLCCKCSNKTKCDVLDFIVDLYASPNKVNYQNVQNLVLRLLGSMSEIEQYHLIPKILEISFPENLNRIRIDNYPNPFSFIKINNNEKNLPILDIKSEKIELLLEQALSDDINKRCWAITSLAALYDLNLLDIIQVNKFAEALWIKVDNEHSFPDNTNFYKFVFLSLPYPACVKPAILLKSYVRSESFPIQRDKKDKGVSISRKPIVLVHEIIGANSDDQGFWSEEDAIEMLEKLLKWWDADKDRINEKKNDFSIFPSVSDEFRSRFSQMIKLISEVVIPKLSPNCSDYAKASLTRLIKELQEYQLPTLEAEAASIHIYPEKKIDILDRIKDALSSGQKSLKNDGLRAIKKTVFDNDELSNSVAILGLYLSWCPLQSISSVFNLIISILKNNPSGFSADIERITLRKLDTLLLETSYENKNSDLNFDESLEIRRVSSFLAATLWDYYESRDLILPQVLHNWRETCLLVDEFAEIRKTWDKCLQAE